MSVADGPEPVDMVNLSSPFANNFIVKNLDLPLRFVCDLLGEPEHEQLTDGQGGGPPTVFLNRWKFASGRRLVVERHSEARPGEGLHLLFSFFPSVGVNPWTSIMCPMRSNMVGVRS